MSKTTEITARNNTNAFNNKGLSFVFFAALGLSILGLAGCSSSGSDPAPEESPVVTPDQDASGLYKSGTGTLNGVTVSDLVGFVDNNRMMFFSVAENILIDGTINSKITGNDYTATVTLYVDGVVKQTDISITGTVTTASKISGAMGNDSFMLLFDPLYDRGATIARIETDTLRNPWGGPVSSRVSDMSVSNLDFSSSGLVNKTLVKVTPLMICLFNGGFQIQDAAVNIYTLLGSLSGTSCDAQLISDNYEGFSAVIDGSAGGADSVLLYAIVDGNSSIFGVFTR